MAELVRGRWGCNDDEAIWRRAHSGGEDDEVEPCKILGWKDEVGKSQASWVMIKLTWLDHVEPVICKSCDHDIIYFAKFFFKKVKVRKKVLELNTWIFYHQ